MSETDMSWQQRELIIMIGIAASGKSYYVDKNFSKTHQVISESHIVEAMKLEGMEFDEDFKNAVMAVSTRALMIKGLPIVIDEPNLLIESLFVWKNLAYQHKYIVRAIVVDTPVEICLDRLKGILGNINEELKQVLYKQDDQLQEVLMIFNMEHQKIVDEVSFIHYDGG